MMIGSFLSYLGKGMRSMPTRGVQRVGIEEPQPAHNLDVSGQHYSLLFDQEKLILSNLFRADQQPFPRSY
jgi:hypothetical protein